MENKKQKRFYKKNEIIWVVKEKKEGKVKLIDKESKKIVVEVEGEDREFNLWEVDKLKYSAREKLLKSKSNKNGLPTVYFAKVKEDAIIPSKRDEDAGYDIYCCVEGVNTEEGFAHEILLEKGKVNYIPTGIASYNNKMFYLDLKHERSSIAKLGVVLLAGCVDSGFLGEIKIMAMPLLKDILITDKVENVEELNDVILYPYKKAFAQIIINPVPSVNIEEITYSELNKKPSTRKDGGWGSSGK